MKPYNAQKLPISDLEWDKFIPQISEANRSIARYDGTLQSMINPNLLLSPLATQEAVLSSRIEGTQATFEEVMEHEARISTEKTPETEKEKDLQEIRNYRQALQNAQKEMKTRPMSLNLVKKIHSTLLNSVRGQHKRRGEFRKEQNWIGPPGSSMDNAQYVPPKPSQIEELMSNLEEYIHSDEKDPIVQLAFIHAQFEIIHPFLDGNGRVGRILVPLFLYEKNILQEPMFYISSYLESNREEYYHSLKNISTEGRWEKWIQFFLTAVTGQAQSNSKKASSILDLYNEIKERLSEAPWSQYSIKTLDAIFDKPVFRRSDFIERTGIPSTSAKRILTDMLNDGILTTKKKAKGRQAAILQFNELVKIISR